VPSDKLLKLTLDVGAARRARRPGMAGAYAPRLVARPSSTSRTSAGEAPRVVSQGMILAAGDAEVLGLSAVDRDVPAGTLIR